MLSSFTLRDSRRKSRYRDTPDPLSGVVGPWWYQHGVDTNTSCADCGDGLDHCHGTVIAHRDGATQCTEPHCAAADPVRHALVAACAEVDGGCACVAEAAPLDVAGAA
jgi:hypothetical protein